jgi:hypothetical protein
MTPDEIENLFSYYLFDSWSYSKVNSFARNEKAFEMQYIFNKGYKISSTTVAGQAYHKALEFYFNEKIKGATTDIATLQSIIFDYIDNVGADKWKIQKTTPTIEECQAKANKIGLLLLQNFFADIKVYESEIKSVLYVELYGDEFLTINGVDIPLPCLFRIDLVVKNNDDKVVIIDHKSVSSFTDDKELKFSIGKQAITYVNGLEAKTDLVVDEVWFVENKTSQNRDKSPQIACFKVEMNKDNRRLYESLLYENLKRMLQAISDPDYIYMINDGDNFVDMAEIYDFWCETQIAEISDFNIPENKKGLITKRLKKIRDVSIATIDPILIKKFRENASEFIQFDLSFKDMTKEEKIEHVLRTLNLIVKVEHTFNGYSSDTFLLEISAGTNLSSIFRYKLDIASALDVPSIRIMKNLYVYQGKAYVAIEASKKRDTTLFFDSAKLNHYDIPIGIDNFNQLVTWDMMNPATPHVLICGSTGSGKSVCLISIIEYCKLAGVDSIIIFDPKFEFLVYKNKPGFEVYNDIEEIEAMMELQVNEMNRIVKTGINKSTLIVFDEFADAVANSRSGSQLNVYEDVHIGNFANGNPKFKRELIETKKSLEENLRILLQKGRSSGFHIVSATQRASVKVITGDAKINYPVAICFRVPKEVDSKVVIDESGAESLSGKGDGLIKSPQYPNPVRFQCFYKI